MKKLWKWLFGTRTKQCVIHDVSKSFLREGKTITNQKFVKTPRPNIIPAPQSRKNVC